MGRGPSYPYTDLEGSLAYTRKVYDYVKRGSAPVEAVVKDGLKPPTSSGSQKVIAALQGVSYAFLRSTIRRQRRHIALCSRRVCSALSAAYDRST